jgi:hypothetical protein
MHFLPFLRENTQAFLIFFPNFGGGGLPPTPHSIVKAAAVVARGQNGRGEIQKRALYTLSQDVRKEGGGGQSWSSKTTGERRHAAFEGTR